MHVHSRSALTLGPTTSWPIPAAAAAQPCQHMRMHPPDSTQALQLLSATAADDPLTSYFSQAVFIPPMLIDLFLQDRIPRYFVTSGLPDNTQASAPAAAAAANSEQRTAVGWQLHDNEPITSDRTLLLYYCTAITVKALKTRCWQPMCHAQQAHADCSVCHQQGLNILSCIVSCNLLPGHCCFRKVDNCCQVSLSSSCSTFCSCLSS